MEKFHLPCKYLKLTICQTFSGNETINDEANVSAPALVKLLIGSRHPSRSYSGEYYEDVLAAVRIQSLLRVRE